MPPERTSATYGPSITAASRSVLLELMTVLRAYQDALILIGGWSPYFLLARHQRRDDPFVHVGSIDIDLAVDPARVDERNYATMLELLAGRGYRPAADRRGARLPCSVERIIPSPVTDKPYAIRVDFLTHVEERAPNARRTDVAIQDGLWARKARGCAAAFRHFTTLELSGALPDGGELTLPIRMADLVSCLTMKGIVLGERYREKDAYDIYALAAHYGEGPRAAAALLQPHLRDPLVEESMRHIRAAFATRQANGPAWVAGFLVHPMFAEAFERLRTDAFMVVKEFWTALAPAPEAPPRALRDGIISGP